MLRVTHTDYRGCVAELPAAGAMPPSSVVARLGVERGRWDRLARERLVQQRPRLALVVVRPPVQHSSLWQQAGGEHRPRELHPFLSLLLAATNKVVVGRASFQSRGVDSHRLALWPQRDRLETVQHRPEDFQHRAMLAEFRQRAVVGQLILRAPFGSLGLAGFPYLDHAPEVVFR